MCSTLYCLDRMFLRPSVRPSVCHRQNASYALGDKLLETLLFPECTSKNVISTTVFIFLFFVLSRFSFVFGALINIFDYLFYSLTFTFSFSN